MSSRRHSAAIANMALGTSVAFTRQPGGTRREGDTQLMYVKPHTVCERIATCELAGGPGIRRYIDGSTEY